MDDIRGDTRRSVDMDSQGLVCVVPGLDVLVAV